MTPATSFVSKPSRRPIPWSSCTTWSPVRRSANDWSARPRRASARGRALAEDLRVREQDEPELAPDEAAARRRDREGELALRRELVARLEQAGLDAAEQVLRAQRLAAVRERDDDAVARVGEAAQLVLRLGEPAGRDRRPLRLERVRLALRERVELGRALERGLGRARELLGPDLAHLVRAPDEVRALRDRGHEVAGNRRRLVLVGERRLGQVEPALGGGPDRRALDRVQRALREGREGADALDLVAEELDPQRLAAGGRVDVDDPAAERELAALLDAVDALVAGEREVLGERVDARLVADLEAQRLGPGRRRRHPLGERGRRGDDEPAAGEHVERAVALADEVRRRREARLPADAAARQQADVLGAEEPAGGLGEVARVAVLGHEHGERRARAARGAPRRPAAGQARTPEHASGRRSPRRPGDARSRRARGRTGAVRAGP